MNKPETFTLILTHTDGSRERSGFPAQADKSGTSGLVEDLLSLRVLSLQMKDRLLIVPSANIRSVEIYPVPEKLPEVVLQDVQRLVQEE
jgi:hypothetical protein